MTIDVVVEVPKGERNKYEIDHTTGRVRLDRTLFTSTHYPGDYGYVEGTLAEDGDPLDALVLLDEPTFPGCLVTARPVALFDMSDENGADAKLLVVPATDPRWDGIQDVTDLDHFLLNEISHFFAVYKTLEPGKGASVGGWHDRAAAQRELDAAVRRALDHAAADGLHHRHGNSLPPGRGVPAGSVNGIHGYAPCGSDTGGEWWPS
jgi:inorganic pyrophosphatase